MASGRISSREDAAAQAGRDARQYMRLHVEECVDTSGEVNCTQLAEGAAHSVEHDEWLDDPDHPVWDWALETAGEYGRAVG